MTSLREQATELHTALLLGRSIGHGARAWADRDMHGPEAPPHAVPEPSRSETA